jgi:hypothetical protein
MPRPLSAQRAPGGRRMTDNRRRKADGQRQ